jgi:hypothetical protein
MLTIYVKKEKTDALRNGVNGKDKHNDSVHVNCGMYNGQKDISRSKENDTEGHT